MKVFDRVGRSWRNTRSGVAELRRRFKALMVDPIELLKFVLEAMLRFFSGMLGIVGCLFIFSSFKYLITSPWPDVFWQCAYKLIAFVVVLVVGFVSVLFCIMAQKAIAPLMQKDDTYIIGFFSALVSFVALVVAMISLIN